VGAKRFLDAVIEFSRYPMIFGRKSILNISKKCHQASIQFVLTNPIFIKPLL